MTDLWRGEWGDSYHARNPCTEAEIAKRIILWRKVFSVMSMEDAPKSFLDVGAGAGANVHAINYIYQHNKIEPEIFAMEPNAMARSELEDTTAGDKKIHVVDGTAAEMSMILDFDMVYTYGVLIHIPEHELAQSMSEIYRHSKRWIFCAEYFAPETQTVRYRGLDDALWRRPYGDLWLDKFDLKLVAYGYEWKRVSGLDDVNWWLMRKTSDKS